MAKQSSEQKPNGNGNSRWKAAGILIALVGMLIGWAWSLGVQSQAVKTNSRDITEMKTQMSVEVSALRVEVKELRQANTTFAIETARLAEAIEQLNARLDREGRTR